MAKIIDTNQFENNIYEHYGFTKRKFFKKKLYRYKIQRNSKQLASYRNTRVYRGLGLLCNIF